MEHGINANIVHGWRKAARERADLVTGKSLEFVPVAVAPVATQLTAQRDVEIAYSRSGGRSGTALGQVWGGPWADGHAAAGVAIVGASTQLRCEVGRVRSRQRSE